MKHTVTFLVALLLAPLAAHSADKNRSELLDRQWVAWSGTGKLEYKTTPTGDRIMDFSHAGYMGGGVALPPLPVKKEVAPSGGDDTAAIQAAIGEVSALPLVNGFRGAVLLKPGTFHCAKPITIAQDGVVLRGSGSGMDGTLIEMTGEPHTTLIIEGPELSFPKETPANTFPIADAYVPAGTLSLSVKDANGLATGDAIRIRWARTAKWIRFMGMDNLARKRKGKPDSPQTWMKEDTTITIHRSIRSIEGNRLTLNVPLSDAIDGQFLDQEPAVVVKTPSVKRLSQCGVESLQIVSPPHKGTLIAGKNISVVLKGDCEDCWVKDIVMRETLNNVQVWGGCRRITITGAHSYHDSTAEKGAGYPADISIRGSQVLVDRCTSHGLGGFYVATLNSAAMLNVVLNCTFEGTGSIQPHMHWSTGLLIDSCNIPDGRIDLINRHTSGSGHGWAIGWGIAWNCTVKYLQIQMPPGALNLAIGCKGEPHKTFSQEAILSPNQPVTPASLYLAQLRERLGEAAVKNIGYSNLVAKLQTMKHTHTLLPALLLALPVVLRAADIPKPASKPNVLILLVDDMGYGDPQCFNSESKIATPNIDNLAAEGMKFTNAHAGASICVPSRYSLLTGRMPYRNWNREAVKRTSKTQPSALEKKHFPQPQLQHEPGRLNLATLMKRQGYATACVGKWHQGMSATAQADGTLKITPVDFGFDSYFGFDAPEQGPYAFIENKRFVVAPTETIEDHPGEGVTNPETQGAHWRKGLAAPGWTFEGYLSTIAGKADVWLTKQSASGGKGPFFLYYAIPAPHAPWATANEFKGKSGAGQYGDYVMNVDAMIGQVMTTLKKLKLKENTLVFFSSDNGPVWYPQDIEKFGHRAAGPWKGMKGDLTDAGHHMPFIASWPGKIKAGSTCGELICFTDIMATLASLLGEGIPTDAGEDSFDISPLLRGEKPAKPIRNGMVHVNYGSYTLAIRQGDWKLILPARVYAVKDGTITPDHIVATTGKGPTEKFQLFNLRTDPGEATNLFAQEPDKAKELFAVLKADIARGRSRP